jgi:transcriptional regulator with XRE-family HTH domain
MAPAAQTTLETGADEALVAHPLRHLRRARMRQFLTQAELAFRAGCDQATISRAEQGRGPSQAIAERIAAALDTTVEELCDHDPNAPPAHAAYIAFKMEHGLLDIEDVAVAVALTPKAVLWWANQGKLPGERYDRFGRKPWLFPPEAVTVLRRLRAESRARKTAQINKHRGTTPRRGESRHCSWRECDQLVYLRPSDANERSGKPVFCSYKHEKLYYPLPKAFVEGSATFDGPARRKHLGRANLHEVRDEGRHAKGRREAARTIAHALLAIDKEPGLTRKKLIDALIRAEEGREALFAENGTRRAWDDPVYRAARKRVVRRLERGFKEAGRPPQLAHLL